MFVRVLAATLETVEHVVTVVTVVTVETVVTVPLFTSMDKRFEPPPVTCCNGLSSAAILCRIVSDCPSTGTGFAAVLSI